MLKTAKWPGAGIVALSLTTLPTAALAQAAPQVEVDDLRAPSSPAFVLLGVEPEAIQRPGTPKALLTSVLSSVGNEDLVPRDYALDVGPYWLFPHPRLTFDRFTRPGLGQSLLQGLSVSVATSQLEGGTGVEGGTGIGLGFRTLVLSGRPNSKIENQDSPLRKRLADIQLQCVRDLANATSEQEKQAIRERCNREARSIADSIAEETKRPIGLLVELAGGATALFQEDRFDRGRLGRAGVWITPAYRLEHPALDILAVGRYMREDTLDVNLWDVGGRLHFQLGDFALSGEFVKRFRSGGQQAVSDDTERYGAVAEYRVQNNLYLVASFGKDYSPPGADDVEPLLAIIGINFGFGKSPLLNMGP